MRSEHEDRPAHGFTAMVLCGGAGTRLRSVLADRPKPLAPVDGEPFLFRLLDQLAAAGCRRAVLCSGHLSDRLERDCGREHGGIELVHSPEPAPLGTAGALAAAAAHVAGEDGVLVLNGDSYVDADFAAFVADCRERAPTAALVAAFVGDAARFGTVRIGAGERVVAFLEKSGSPVGGGWINAGVYWLDREALDTLPAGPASLERDVLPVLAAAGRLRAHRTAGAFLDIGVPESYAAAGAFFAALAARHRRDRKRLLVVDRDGTLIEEKHYLADPAGVALLPGVVDGLRALAAGGYEIAIVTNQSGIGRGYFDAATADAVNGEVLRQLAAAGVEVGGVYVCPHRPDDGCECRKPAPGLIERAMSELGYTADQCLVVGDKKCDVDLGTRLGARTALVRSGYGAATERDGMCAPDRVVDGLRELAALEAPR